MSAKELSIGPAAVGPWSIFPGSEASLDTQGASIDDTIFGQTFQSNEVGLTTWTMSGNCYYKGYAGFKVKIRKAGTPTNVTGASMTVDPDDGQRFFITNRAQSVWDRTATLTVYDGVTDVTGNVEAINYLFGEVLFEDAYSVAGAITVDVDYMPLESLGCADTYTLTMQANAVNSTCFDTAQANGGFTTFDPGLRTVSLELGGTWTKAGSVRNAISSGAEFIIEINPDGQDKSIARGFFRASSESQSGSVGAREDGSYTFNLNVPEGAELPFDWWHASDTPLPTAVRDALDAWMSETKKWYRYSPPSVAGADAERWGSGVLTDMSLEGSLEDMNTFTVSIQGDGILQEV